ncbi:glutamine synthetase family protein [Burkholderia cenocepacia]|uniref:glutamine synthetase family protein n=1 Tax=Burkholderia cenocepacia TaxID=95486 RepID=UPI00406C23D4
MAHSLGFIAKHNLWSDDQRRLAEEIKVRVTKENIELFRIVWADPHGASRAKTVTLPAFLSALDDGYNINVATATLDASGARVFSSFTRGGGMGLEEMTGSPNLIVVPDPATFRILPWEPNVAWILGDEYFTSGKGFHFSPRRLLRDQLDKLAARGMRCVIGLEVEWYLLRLAQDHLSHEDIGAPGLKARAPRTVPVEPGYSFHSESNMDTIHGPVAALSKAMQGLGLPLRSIEKEWGPGQLECTFAPRDALEAADNLVLFRSATRQVCRRLGYLATFMARPGLKGYYSSGWHLHQSIVDAQSRRNLFMPDNAGDVLSPLGMNYLAGLLRHAPAATLLSNPTINAYRRFRVNSLAPDRVAWGTDHRGVMLRVLGGIDDPASRIENRVGEPSANPYLYIASQLIAGFDGVENEFNPGPPDTDPYNTQHTMLPHSLSEALELFEREPLFGDQLGKVFVDYYGQLKRTELKRFEEFVREHNIGPDSEEITEWEQNEYFDFF